MKNIDLFTLKNLMYNADSRLNFALSKTTEFFLANFIYFFALWSSGERRNSDHFLSPLRIRKKAGKKYENEMK